jgi:hypothetical protein
MWLTGHILATVDAADDSANWRLEVAGTIAAACQGDPNLIALLVVTVASALSRGVVLTGSSELDPLRQRVATYPQPLAVAVASRHGQIDNFWRWQMFADRGDLIALHAHFAAVVDRLAHLLFAANQRWWPGRNGCSTSWRVLSTCRRALSKHCTWPPPHLPVTPRGYSQN